MSTKLYVGNLPYQTTESDLQSLFESAGPVSTIPSHIRSVGSGSSGGR